MGIIYSNDLAGKQAKSKNRIQAQVNTALLNLKQTYNNIMLIVFNNPDGLTPQEVFDAFGSDAAELDALRPGVVSFVNALAPGSLSADIPNGRVVTPHQDGTVTVS